ncbi:TPA: aminotransferase class III-fold pyridoxal phosphate-dependent enzyme [Klebsiella michiganensis]|nr:aminotransferase class III-fold pyridoxal phosphate-dependent enzyme [Klebsiella michiganensis]
MKNLVGDVSTAARILPELDGETLIIKQGKGAYLWDIHGKRYVDTALGFGAILVGHADEIINEAVIGALNHGANLSWAHESEQAAATALAECAEELTKVMFVNSGSEAVHLACRAARAFTGKTRIAKAAAGFDGWFDEVTLGNIKSTEAEFTAADVRPANSGFTVFRYNDFDDIEHLFETQKDIAAVLIEPMLANAGCILAAEGYLKHVREVAHRHGALLICDEVLMGFRRHAGLTSHLMGVRPDIVTVGKAIGNGVPVAAVLSTPEILDSFEKNKTLRGGTYSGNPLAAQATISTIETLKKADYRVLTQRGERLAQGIKNIFAENGVHVSITGYGNVFTVWLGEKAPQSYSESLVIADTEFSRDLHLELRREGVLIMPSPYGRIYISFEHGEDVINEMLAAFEKAATRLRHYA